MNLIVICCKCKKKNLTNSNLLLNYMNIIITKTKNREAAKNHLLVITVAVLGSQLVRSAGRLMG